VEFGCAIIVVGLLAGATGAMTTLFLRAVEHLTYHYSFGSLLVGVTESSPWRRALGPMVGGALAGCGWWLLRRRTVVPQLSGAISQRERLPSLPLMIDAVLQILVVGAGASLGREAAPRQFAAALADRGIARWSLTSADREMLLASAAGAGLGAVYSVPVGGALFAARILLGTWQPRALGTALITSALAVAVAAPVTHDATQLVWPDSTLSYLMAALAVVLSPIALGVGIAFSRLMALARAAPATKSSALIPAIAAAGLLIGVCSIWWPGLPGNGKSILTVVLNGEPTLGAAAVILFLKPLLTAVVLRAGAVGGMLTPALATGAATGSVVTLAINAWTGMAISVPAVALTTAAGVVAITQRAPVWAAVFVWELATPPWWLFLVFLAATVTAHNLRTLSVHQRIESPADVA
jgi:H+/Cl- antiporter ClcA